VRAAGWRRAGKGSRRGRGPAERKEKRGFFGGLKRKAGDTTERQTGKSGGKEGLLRHKVGLLTGRWRGTKGS
jgi:hypothetical protein